ncbi:hypothetical protein CDAR_112921 [Caerostris darwini]|uniref:Uncharacterized protein n=1 Tax=Caerostris darwini TaxID=1538125 RepID=A0AAV4PYW4_9ARAC|nr:hypothetical protein CDAR_112921 [Caerostris darwini]
MLSTPRDTIWLTRPCHPIFHFRAHPPPPFYLDSRSPQPSTELSLPFVPLRKNGKSIVEGGVHPQGVLCPHALNLPLPFGGWSAQSFRE